MERADLERWIRAYEAAWRAPGTDAAAALFAEDATYLTHPFAEPVTGPRGDPARCGTRSARRARSSR